MKAKNWKRLGMRGSEKGKRPLSREQQREI